MKVRRLAVAGVFVVAGAWSCGGSSAPGSGGADAAAVDEGYPPAGDDGSEGCVLDGYPCGGAGECCSGVCSGGVCGAGAACTAVGTACDTPDTCCSRLCFDGGCAGED